MQHSKVDAQPAYVLHSYPYRETSLIIEAFTRDFGRISLMARGARRPRSAMRGLLMAFQPLEFAWAGKGEVPNLMKVEWQGGVPLPSGQSLLCGYYLNELLVNLLPRDDPHQTLFAHYGTMLHRLGASGSKVLEADLRWFEKRLLQELGYGLTLDHDCHGAKIDPDAQYYYEVEKGALPAASSPRATSTLLVLGRTLLDLDEDNFSNPRSRLEAKQIMRTLFAYYLAGKPLHSRNIFIEIS